jgi:carbamate kinase
MLIVTALGGNAVSLPGKEGNIADQYAATRAATRPLADLLLAGHRLVITHGNGPQVGNIMRRVEIAAQYSADRVYPLPLDIAVANTQAGMGSMIAQCIMNELAHRGIRKLCSTIVTQVRVDEDDPAMQNPTKPIGPYLKAESAAAHLERDGWHIVEEPPRGWRRVVPSPLPKEIIELPTIRALVEAGQLIIAGGGGGIPVVRDSGGDVRGVEAVIDKDRTSALLAAELNADLLAILTNVDQVQADYGKPTARPIDRISASEMARLIATGQFPAGSMGPKVDAAVDFLNRSKKPDAKVLITSCEHVAEALEGKTGTWITRG